MDTLLQVPLLPSCPSNQTLGFAMVPTSVSVRVHIAGNCCTESGKCGLGYLGAEQMVSNTWEMELVTSGFHLLLEWAQRRQNKVNLLSR